MITSVMQIKESQGWGRQEKVLAKKGRIKSKWR